MKNMRLPILVIVVLSLTVMGCPRGENGGEAASNEIRIGEYGSLTGSTATFGQSTHQGIQIAIDEINAAGGIKGRKIRLFTEDDQSKPEEAANAVTKLISQNGVVAILGEVASSRSLAAAPICQQNGVPMITPSSTNPKVTEVGDFIFRVCFLDSFQGLATATYVTQELKFTRGAILRDVKNDYSVGLAQFFAEAFRQKGGRIVADQSYSEGDSDFRSQLTAIRRVNPQFIYIPGYYTEVGQIAIQARDLGIKVPLVGGDGWESPKLLEIGGKALEGCYYSNHYYAEDPNPAVQTFVKKHKEIYGVEPDSLGALAYDAAKILGAAMARTANLDKKEIRDEIENTKDYQGVTGIITIGPDRNAVKPLVVLRVENQRLALRAVVTPEGVVTAVSPTAAPTSTAATATGTR
jgi:branched-chain amino acid transport system substrate-binding protein